MAVAYANVTEPLFIERQRRNVKASRQIHISSSTASNDAKASIGVLKPKHFRGVVLRF